MLKKIILALIVVFIVVGALVGDYFVDYALKRDENNADAIPAACVNILDPTREVPQKPESASEEWNIKSADGLNLYATHFLPSEQSHKWVVLVHGYGRDQRYVWDYVDEYLTNGYNVLTPDLQSSGKGEGKYLTMGIKESDDICLWIAKIVETDSQAQIVLHGVSMGAATVILAAAKENSPNLVAVVEDCSYTSAYDMFAAQLKKIYGLPAFPIMNFVDVMSKIKTGVKLSDAAPIEVVKNIKVPIMFIHGTADDLTPYSMMNELYDNCASPAKEIMTVEGAGHADSMVTNPKSYFEKIFSFLNR